eukprot:CAMPEP_0194362486 /NCGR_PEP_ID=MMETSP0174-20130528/10243_1 /TAXON_ID=216777 /ORGANISM="Proboscia alata, Strain PI-D3" /LENGTH=68 /DNA_ID=CAMNT_0039135387 /DNA_START=374 /DNA_END=580 /DNA_ORIENTATION=-
MVVKGIASEIKNWDMGIWIDLNPSGNSLLFVMSPWLHVVLVNSFEQHDLLPLTDDSRNSRIHFLENQR